MTRAEITLCRMIIRDMYSPNFHFSFDLVSFAGWLFSFCGVFFFIHYFFCLPQKGTLLPGCFSLVLPIQRSKNKEWKECGW